jgi:hypothetical protein
LISNSNNKAEVTWNVIKSISGRNNNKPEIRSLNIDGRLSNNHVSIAESLNKYFLNIVENINLAANNLTNGFDPAYHLKYMAQAFVNPFPNINFTQTTYIEI